MIIAIIFDFDGVLVESANIKTMAFHRLFSDYPDKVEELVEYHKRNMGFSRYVKFRYFYEEILKQIYTEDIGKTLNQKFSKLVVESIKKALLVKGAKEFLEFYCQTYLMFIASGTPQKELEEIVHTHHLETFFAKVCGTPTTKEEIIRHIEKEYSLNSEEMIFIGDAESDRIAAEATDVNFIARIVGPDSLLYDCAYRIDDLQSLPKIIKEIENK